MGPGQNGSHPATCAHMHVPHWGAPAWTSLRLPQRVPSSSPSRAHWTCPLTFPLASSFSSEPFSALDPRAGSRLLEGHYPSYFQLPFHSFILYIFIHSLNKVSVECLLLARLHSRQRRHSREQNRQEPTSLWTLLHPSGSHK